MDKDSHSVRSRQIGPSPSSSHQYPQQSALLTKQRYLLGEPRAQVEIPFDAVDHTDQANCDLPCRSGQFQLVTSYDRCLNAMAEHQTYADISGPTFPAMATFLLDEARKHELDVLHNATDRTSIKAPMGVVEIRDLGNATLRFSVEAGSVSDLHVLRDAVVSHIVALFPDMAETIRWSDAPNSGQHPPNFQFATVLACQDLSTDFVRVTLQLERADSFTDKAIHFRFVFPKPDDPAPLWPTLQENGATLWPKGDKALHLPVYTIRARRGDKVDVDIFRHPGGRTLAWAETTAIGDQVGLIGPGGGGVLHRDRIILAGDATAFPAIARLLEALPEDAGGQVFLRPPGKAQDYPMRPGPKMSLTWLQPDDPNILANHAARAIRAAPEHFLWFAASKPDVTALRAMIADLNIDKADKYVAQFWSA